MFHFKMNSISKSILGAQTKITQYLLISRRTFQTNGPVLHRMIERRNNVFPEIYSTNNLDVGIVRSYSKSKDKGKDKGKKAGNIHISPSQMSALVDYVTVVSKFDSAIEHLKEDFSKNLSLRSTTGSIESLKVPFEGKDYELQELAEIVRKNPKTIVLNMAAFPQVIPDVLKSIQSSGMNLNPQQDGTTLFVPIPKVTKEHREHLAKNASILYRKHNDILKNLNVKYTREIKNAPGASEDSIHSVLNQLNALSSKYNVLAKEILNEKVRELTGKD